MSVIKATPRVHRRSRQIQSGATVVEFALIVLVFFMFLLAVIELARVIFLYNTLNYSTRSAAQFASTADFTDGANLDKIRQSSIFRTAPGNLVLAPELTDKAVRIDYMWLSRTAAGPIEMQAIAGDALPASPAENRLNCLSDPYSPTCIRLVRVRICDPANTDGCTAMRFRTLTSIIPLEMALPIATTVAPAQSLGLTPN